MNEDDELFWTTYIAITPEEDKDFAGCLPVLGWIAVAALVLFALVWCFQS